MICKDTLFFVFLPPYCEKSYYIRYKISDKNSFQAQIVNEKNILHIQFSNPRIRIIPPYPTTKNRRNLEPHVFGDGICCPLLFLIVLADRYSIRKCTPHRELPIIGPIQRRLAPVGRSLGGDGRLATTRRQPLSGNPSNGSHLDTRAPSRIWRNKQI